jgi:hypothetical protein
LLLPAFPSGLWILPCICFSTPTHNKAGHLIINRALGPHDFIDQAGRAGIQSTMKVHYSQIYHQTAFSQFQQRSFLLLGSGFLAITLFRGKIYPHGPICLWFFLFYFVESYTLFLYYSHQLVTRQAISCS